MAIVLADTEFDALETAIYEAALVPERWVDVLDRLSTLSGGVGGVIWSARDGTTSWTASPRMSPITRRFAGGEWSASNHRSAAADARGVNNLPRFFTEADLFDTDDYTLDPFYTDFILPEGLGWFATTAVKVPDHDLLTVSIERARSEGPIPPEAISALDRLRPHIARSTLIAARLAFERSRTAIETLEHLGFAAAAVTGTGRVLIANQAFESGDGGWLLSGGDRLTIPDERRHAMLADSLSRLGSSTGVRSIALRVGGEKVDSVMHLVPIRGAAQDLFARAAAVVVVTRSRGNDPSPGPELIQALFDLTPSEAMVARRLGQGETVEQVARASGKSVLTVRTQLKSVLAKTGTRRQSELVRLLARLIPPSL